LAAYSGNIWTSRYDDEFNAVDIYYQTPDTLLSYYDSTIGSNPIFPFYSNFILDPVSNKTFYLPTINSVWRKDDMAAASKDTLLRNVGWSKLNNLNLSESVQITALGISVEPANRLYIGTNNGHVYRVDGANTGDPVPVEITCSDFPINAYIACLDVNRQNADQLTTVFSNYGVQSIYYTDDGGTTWTHISGNLEQYPDGTGAGPSVRWVKTLNYDDNTIYFAGTSIGLYFTDHLNGDDTEWVKEGSDGIGCVMVDMIDTRETDGFIAIATQGNGIYSTYYDPSAGTSDNFSDDDFKFSCYPNPFKQHLTVEFELDKPAYAEIVLLNIHGQLVEMLYKGNRPSGNSLIKIARNGLAPGIYFIGLRINGQSKTKKVIVT